MRFWRRRRRGRHDLGAAVTGLPSAPPAAVTPASPAAAFAAWPTAPSTPAAPRVPAAPVVGTAPAVPLAHAAPEPAPAEAVPSRGPRVELGFRDGSTAALDPASEQARALAGLAESLTTPR